MNSGPDPTSQSVLPSPERKRKVDLIGRLINPLDASVRQPARRKIQFLASISLVLTLAAAFSPVVLKVRPIQITAFAPFNLVAVPVGLLLYLISRSKAYETAAVCLILLTEFTPLGVLILQHGGEIASLPLTLAWLVIGFLLAIPLLSFRFALFLCLCTALPISLLPRLIPGVGYSDLVPMFGFLGISAVLSLIIIFYRDRIINDLTQAASTNQNLLDGISGSFPGFFFLSDSSGNLERWNASFAETVQRQTEELKRISLTEAFGDGNRQTIATWAEQAFAAGRREGEIWLPARNGRARLFQLSLRAQTLNGETKILGFGTDITEFKRLEDARQAVVDSPMQSLAICRDGKIAFTNPAFAKLFGYHRNELYAMDSTQVLSLILEQDRHGFEEALQEVREQEKSTPHLEIRILRKDGYQRWLEVSLHAINYRGQAAIQMVAMDCTERKDTEAQQVRLISELEAKNAELERFTYTVSHDLKSPLITIRGFLGFLERDAIAQNKARLQADLERITEATDKMQRLLNDLLKLSRVGHVVNPPEDLPFELVVKEAVERVGGQILRRGPHIVIDEGMPMVRVDRERAVEIVQNLVDNAVKFMGDQSDPQIEIGSCGTEGSGMAIFFVKDNGMGVDPQFHDRIFGLFNKLDPGSEGTGVGLALVKRIVEVHGGKIWVLSKGKGSGTTFYFTLPLAMSTSQRFPSSKIPD